LGMDYACDSQAMLYKSPDVISGLGSQIRTNFFSWSVADNDAYIHENYSPFADSPSPSHVKCVSNGVTSQPKLYFYSVDILSYNLWLLIMFLVYGTPLAIKYYQTAGILN
jgi:hypothetical protein